MGQHVFEQPQQVEQQQIEQQVFEQPQIWQNINEVEMAVDEIVYVESATLEEKVLVS